MEKNIIVSGEPTMKATQGTQYKIVHIHPQACLPFRREHPDNLARDGAQPDRSPQRVVQPKEFFAYGSAQNADELAGTKLPLTKYPSMLQ